MHPDSCTIAEAIDHRTNGLAELRIHLNHWSRRMPNIRSNMEYADWEDNYFTRPNSGETPPFLRKKCSSERYINIKTEAQEDNIPR